jgi:O-antigen ligase
MKKLSAAQLYSLALGFFLGLCVWKFGNPVILDHKIPAPANAAEWFHETWPPHWANFFLLPFVVAGIVLIVQQKNILRVNRWLLWLPLAWLGWQFFSATKTVDQNLTAATLWQFAGVTACYFLGLFFFSRENLWRWLLPGLLAAFTFCLVRAVDQRLFEFPTEHQVFAEGERTGWTNFPPEAVASMKLETLIITTNGADIANPVFMKKLERGRVYGTLVYPNALAGIILLLWPLSLALVLGAAKNFRPPIRYAALALTIFLGAASLFWSGSKLGWLLAIFTAGLFVLRLDWSKKLKLISVAAVLVIGLGIFAVRFQNYFVTGAHSAGARLQYWHAAAKITQANPVFGTGPGTFQRPYEKMKSPDEEMARLTHNDFLEQFSDSGLPGGIFYAAWILLALAAAAWCLQGLGEFSLYIPALAWTACLLLGVLVAMPAITPASENAPASARAKAQPKRRP